MSQKMIDALTKLVEGAAEFEAAFDEREAAEEYHFRNEAVEIRQTLWKLHPRSKLLKHRLEERRAAEEPGK